MSGYTRQQSYIDGDVILAEHTNDEFDLLAEVFDTTLGHKHDGTTAEGPTIDLLSDDDGDTKIQVEEGADDDTIRFDTLGSERVTITSSVITKNLPLQAEVGSAAVTSYSFTGDANTGIFSPSANNVGISSNGINTLNIGTTGLRTLDGSAANPSYSFLSDQNTGMFLSAADTLNLATGGTAWLTIGSAGATTMSGATTFNSGATFSGSATYNIIPAFNGGTSGVSAPFTVDSTFVVTNLNADLLDGVEGANYLRKDVSNNLNNDVTFTLNSSTGAFPITFSSTDSTNDLGLLWATAGTRLAFVPKPSGSSDFTKEFSYNFSTNRWEFDSDPYVGSNVIWHAGNDGAGSGLDADTLDGVQGSSYLRSDTTDTLNGILTITNGVTDFPLLIQSADSAAGIGFSDNTSTSATHVTIGAVGNDLVFRAGNVERVRIDSSGNVGIGETAPLGRLHVKTANSGAGSVNISADDLVVESATAAGITLLSAITGEGNIYFGDSDSATAGRIQYVHNGDYMRFYTNNVERARIDSSGNVGINTTSPQEFLHIKAGSNSTTDYPLRIENSADTLDTGYGAYGMSNREGTSQSTSYTMDIGGALICKTNGSERARIDSNGDFFIGTTSGVSTITTGVGLVYDVDNALSLAVNASNNGFITNKTDYVSGTTTHISFRENGTTRGSITSNGSTTAYNTTSDYRLKENVVDLTDATSRLKELPVHRFNFIGLEETIDGFLAHEVQAVVPEAVTGEKDVVDPIEGPQYQMMDASKLVPLLTAALKESIERIEMLEQKIASFEKDLATYDSRLVTMENK